MAPRLSAQLVLGGLTVAMLLLQASAQGIVSTTTAATTYSTIAFTAVPTNPSALVSNNPRSSPSATINGVLTPIPSWSVLASSGWVDTTGNVLGQLLVRPRLLRVCALAVCDSCFLCRPGLRNTFSW